MPGLLPSTALQELTDSRVAGSVCRLSLPGFQPSQACSAAPSLHHPALAWDPSLWTHPPALPLRPPPVLKPVLPGSRAFHQTLAHLQRLSPSVFPVAWPAPRPSERVGLSP